MISFRAVRATVLVEGVTDQLAVTLAARRLGRDLEAEGVSVVPTNGAHAIGRFLRRLAAEQPRAQVAGLYDEAEEEVIRSALKQAGMDSAGFFACRADLEEELIRAAGETTVLALIEEAGDARPWRRFTSQPVWRGRPVDQQFRRFMRSVSERNARYIRAMVETMDPPQLPRPLRQVLDFVSG